MGNSRDSLSYPVLESCGLRNSTKKTRFSGLHIVFGPLSPLATRRRSIISVKRELTTIALGSRPRRFLTAKLFSWTTAGVDSDILDSEIRCQNVRDDSIFKQNVIRPSREKACERCLNFKYFQTKSIDTLMHV